MTGNELKLNDISDELLIFSKATIDTLFSLDNCADCIALYVFYYKTAKWQKTNTIWATDKYVAECLKWGYKKISNTKNSLKEKGLINMVQKREDGKIAGWYIEICYIVTENKIAKIKVINNYQKQELPKARTTESKKLLTEDKCLKNIKYKCLKKYKVKCLKNNSSLSNDNNELTKDKKKDTSLSKESSVSKEKINYEEIVNLFNDICKSYPRVTKISTKRKGHIRARLNDYSLNDLKIVFENMENSDFLKGNNNRKWSATFDWVISSENNMAKVFEGNYKNKDDGSHRYKEDGSIDREWDDLWNWQERI